MIPIAPLNFIADEIQDKLPIVRRGDSVKALLPSSIPKYDNTLHLRWKNKNCSGKTTNQICNLIFFPRNSIVFILKSIPKIKCLMHVEKCHFTNCRDKGCVESIIRKSNFRLQQQC